MRVKREKTRTEDRENREQSDRNRETRADRAKDVTKKRLSLKDLRAKLPVWFAPSRLLPAAGLVIVLVLFGRDMLSSMQVTTEIRELRRQKTELEAGIAADSALLRNLEDPAFLERYAREHYLMRRAGEDVYVLIDN